jgi:plastocyanin
MRSGTTWLAVSVIGSVAAIAAGSAFASGHAPAGVTVKVTDKGSTYVINKQTTDTMYFTPATTTVKSGSMLTFEYGGKPSQEPHTMTIVNESQLPTTPAQLDNCTICDRLASGHLKNPKAPPGPGNDIVHWVLNKGRPGLDAVGDSIAIEGPSHKSISIEVTAPAGTTLYFMCAVHPWMQAKLVVT